MKLKEVGLNGLRVTRLLSLRVKGSESGKEPHFLKIVKSCCVLALERNFIRFFSI